MDDKNLKLPSQKVPSQLCKAVPLLIALGLSACAGTGSRTGVDSTPGPDDPEKLAELAEESSTRNIESLDNLTDAQLNQILSEGYSSFYAAASGLKWLDKALILKAESEAVGKLATETSEYMAKLASDLEELNKNYPSLSIDNEGLPVMESLKRKAAQKDRLESFAPLVGSTGREFERTLLLTLSGAFNQLRFLARVMQEQEKSDERQALLLDIQQNFDRLYAADVKLLDDVYFVK